MMNCGFGTLKTERSILEWVLLTPTPFYRLTKFTIPENEAKTRWRRRRYRNWKKTRNRDEETREGKKEVVQTAPVSNATTFPPKRNLKVGKPHVATTPFAVNETRSPRLTLSIFRRVQPTVYFSTSLGRL